MFKGLEEENECDLDLVRLNAYRSHFGLSNFDDCGVVEVKVEEPEVYQQEEETNEEIFHDSNVEIVEEIIQPEVEEFVEETVEEVQKLSEFLKKKIKFSLILAIGGRGSD